MTRVRAHAAVPIVAALLIAMLARPAAAVPSQGKLDEARGRAEELEGDVASAQAKLRRVEAELAVLEEELAAMQAQLDEALDEHRRAEAQAMAASARARSAERELAAAIAELEENLDRLGELARDSYKHGAPSASPAMVTLELMGNDSAELADRLHFLTRGLETRSKSLERSTALRIQVDALTARAREEEQALARQERAAQAQREEAARLHAGVQDLVSEQSIALDTSMRLVAELEKAQEQAVSRVGELKAQVEREKKEAARRERERRERERRERERRERARREQQRREQQERERRAQAARQPAGGGSGSASGPVSVSPGPSPALRRVGGITVAASIAPQLEALLNHARRDGIELGGHGYRSPQVTARLRRANGCPDVHRSPASACRVPTARPGSSMHEQGMAVDFTYRGSTICFPRSASRCSGNAAFAWLQRHAGSYGLRNLPSEAWHWSSNGR